MVRVMVVSTGILCSSEQETKVLDAKLGTLLNMATWLRGSERI